LLVGQHGPDTADIRHSGKLHSGLTEQLVGNRWELLQSLCDHRFSALGDVVSEVGRYA
jgi:hypothetical protein